MTEKQRIERMMEKHKAYFENVKGVDVAFSTKGDCFFYEYNEEYNEYTTYVRFFTAEELEQIIEDNIATDYCIQLQAITEETLRELDAPARQEISVDTVVMNSYSLNREILTNAFIAFYNMLEKAYEYMKPFKNWTEDLECKSESNSID